MKPGESCLNQSIFSLSDGHFVGTVKDIYLDSELKRVVGLYLGSEGLLRRTAKIVKAEYVELLGVDVVLTNQSEIVTTEEHLDDFKTWVRRETLKGRLVNSPSGNKIGQVGDVMVSNQGEVVRFTLAETYIAGPIAQQQAISRQVMLQPGDETQPMIIDQIKAEQPLGGSS